MRIMPGYSRWILLFLAISIFSPQAKTVAAPKAKKAAGSFLIPAYAFDRGNVKTFTKNHADAGPMVAYGGISPIEVAYDIDFPITAEYSINIYYASAVARPTEIFLDEIRIGTCCRTTTGGFNTSQAKWEQSCKLNIRAGKHTIRLRRNVDFPHVVGLRFDSDKAFPKDWKLHRPKARDLNSPQPAALKNLLPPAPRIPALRLAIEDLIATFGSAYPDGPEYIKRLQVLEQKSKQLEASKSFGSDAWSKEREKYDADLATLHREALMANPLLDFDRLLVVMRTNNSPALGLPRNWQSNSSLPKKGFNDRIAVLSELPPGGKLDTLFEPKTGRFVGDVDLHFGADRMLFSMPDDKGRWQVFEIGVDGGNLRQLTGEQPDVDSYDACYLPNGKVMFTSTACFVGVPCVYGSSHVAVLYVMDEDGRNIRQLCFDQEHDWCPVVMNNGRVLYSRWEYTDTPHSNTRLLFHMNPDGTEQMEYYGSNSYWPNSVFYARPIPGHATKVAGIVGGHHDHPRMGELVLFDPAKGRRESAGAVQRIPGHGKKVEPIIRDGLTLSSWPKFLHPYPLSEKYFIVSCKPSPLSSWGIYLVDAFDNMLLLKESLDHALLEPIPLRPTPRPPVLPEKVDLTRKDAVVFLPDIYAGDGLKGIPRGTVKSMRIFTYHFAYQDMGGLLGVVGMDGPWDIKRVLGTVPVNEDGSAKFRIPANTPISMQPLDSEGKALQLMRSWMTAMPGEVVQCAGCHENQNSTPPSIGTIALNKPPAEIEPWYGPLRGFSYAREVQPVIDKHCVGCHNGEKRADGSEICDLRGTVKLKDWRSITPGNGGEHAGKFTVGYAELHRFVRRPGIESDYHLLEPMEFHADTTQLVQMLQQGHHGVRLGREDWDRLITWIDLNCPFHGTWGEEIDNPGRQRQRRRELLKLYANVDDDPEAVPVVPAKHVVPISPEKTHAEKTPVTEKLTCPGWPFDA
ncbi:MAG: hypothetical protein JXM70_21275, partial [Pirellulales bacterium]|nr:hypothetical protein [Pirellulales bacterium]